MSDVLLVEDDPHVSLALRTRIEAAGYEVACVQDSVFALDHVMHYSPEIVLLDINLPDGDGFEVSSALRDCMTPGSYSLIFITASNNPEYRIRAEQLGAFAFLQKPFASSELLDAIDQCRRHATATANEMLPR